MNAGLPPSVTRLLSGWGNWPVEECDVYRPERIEELRRLLRAPLSGGVISRGAGRSYGDAALNGGGGVLSQLRLDRILLLDPGAPTVEAEGGVLLGDLNDLLRARGLSLPVLPGTRQVTVGGAIACDVHGKNHLIAGSFSSCVESLTLMAPGGEVIEVSPHREAELFRATVGGMGLTGAIVSARLRPSREAGEWMRVRATRTSDLSDHLQALDRESRSGHAAGWLDFLRPDRSRPGVVLSATPSSDAPDPGSFPRSRVHLRVPFFLPPGALAPALVRAHNRLRLRQETSEEERLERTEEFLFPLDRIGDWNRLYGRRGLAQFQVVLDTAQALDGFEELLRLTHAAAAPPYLGVVKRLGGVSPGLLSFPRDGYTLALDLPVRAGTRDLLTRMEGVAVRRGGRVYLAKDAALSPEGFRAMYPDWERFLQIRRRIDVSGTLSSSLARRVGLA